jgi:hypothetical protein
MLQICKLLHSTSTQKTMLKYWNRRKKLTTTLLSRKIRLRLSRNTHLAFALYQAMVVL